MAYTVSCRVLLKNADLEGVYEAFLRMNTGSENLSEQEIRHVAFGYADTTVQFTQHHQHRLCPTSLAGTFVICIMLDVLIHVQFYMLLCQAH